MNQSKFVIKISYPQRSETVILYYIEPNKQGGKKEAKEFNSKEEANQCLEQIEELYGRKLENWAVEKA